MSGNVQVRIDDGIAWIVMDDGKVNALSRAMIAEIDEALDVAEAACAVTVIEGRTGIFSAGFDLRTFTRGAAAGVDMMAAGARLVARLLAFPFPVLTVCTGHAYPAGAFLMLSADVRLGAAGPWRIGMNEVAIGLTVPLFAVELARHRLSPAAFSRITTAPMFAPDEAARCGYLDRVVDAVTLSDAAGEEARRLRTLDMPSYSATKQRVNARVLGAIRDALDLELKTASPA